MGGIFEKPGYQDIVVIGYFAVGPLRHGPILAFMLCEDQDFLPRTAVEDRLLHGGLRPRFYVEISLEDAAGPLDDEIEGGVLVESGILGDDGVGNGINTAAGGEEFNFRRIYVGFHQPTDDSQVVSVDAVAVTSVL